MYWPLTWKRHLTTPADTAEVPAPRAGVETMPKPARTSPGNLIRTKPRISSAPHPGFRFRHHAKRRQVPAPGPKVPYAPVTSGPPGQTSSPTALPTNRHTESLAGSARCRTRRTRRRSPPRRRTIAVAASASVGETMAPDANAIGHVSPRKPWPTVPTTTTMARTTSMIGYGMVRRLPTAYRAHRQQQRGDHDVTAIHENPIPAAT